MLLSPNKEVAAISVTKQVSNLSLIKELSAPIFKWVEMSDPPMLVNHIKWPGGGGSQKVNPFLSEIFFFTICKILFPLIDDVICERPLTAPPPTQPTKSAQRKQKRGAAQHLLWVHIVPLLSCFLPLEMTSHNKTHNNQFILF